jgi:general secretion pathway protein C
MPSSPQVSWWLRLVTFLVWGLAAASVVHWGLKWFTPPPKPVAAVASGAVAVQADAAAISRLLGAVQAAAPVAASVASRFSLVGVVAGLSSGGAALIAVDGKPARPYRVGARIDDSLVLQSVGPRVAVLAPAIDAPAALTLEMPVKTSAVAGTNVLPPTRQPPQVMPAPAMQRPAAAPSMPPSAARSAASRMLERAGQPR